MTDTQYNYFSEFETYFQKPVALKAAASLVHGAEMEFHIQMANNETEVFTFFRERRENTLIKGKAIDPQVIFILPEKAAKEVLSLDISETLDVGLVGVHILKLIFSPDSETRIQFKIKAGFMTLFTKGYLGVIAAGGSAFASYLATKGFDGMNAVRAALKNVGRKN